VVETSGLPASGAQGEFGHAVPVRPASGSGGAQVPDWCLRGHYLGVGGAGVGWSHFYRLTDITCRVCAALRDPAANWCLLDPARQYPADSAPGQGLVLAVVPPSARGGIGRIELRLARRPVGEVALAACGPCHRAVLVRVLVPDEHRRLGYGRVLIAAALARAPASRYHWSTVRGPETVAAKAFWAAVRFPGKIGEPGYCSDMLR